MNAGMGKRRNGGGGGWFARAAVLTVLLAGACAAADLDAPAMVKLLDTYEWFPLHDAIAAGAHPPLFVRGAMACIFNDTRHCQKDMEHFVRTKAPAFDIQRAHDLLTFLYARTGRFGPALEHRQAMRRHLENPPPVDELLSFFSAFHEFPEMSVAAFRPSTIQCERPVEKLEVPVTINGKPAKYILDTAADISFATESEAERLGLRFAARACGGAVDYSEKVLDARCAVADSLELGGIRLRNVPFLVVRRPDGPASLVFQGLIGLEPLLACKTVSWNKEGVLRLGYRDRPRAARANLYLDEMHLIVRTRYGNRDLAFVLDSGGGIGTRVYQRFAGEFRDVVNAAGKPERVVESGMGGDQDFDVPVLTDLALEVGGFRAVVPKAPLLPLGEGQDQVERFDHASTFASGSS